MKKKRRAREKHYFRDLKKPAMRARIERKARKHRTRIERGDARHHYVSPQSIEAESTEKETT